MTLPNFSFSSSSRAVKISPLCTLRRSSTPPRIAEVCSWRSSSSFDAVTNVEEAFLRGALEMGAGARWFQHVGLQDLSIGHRNQATGATVLVRSRHVKILLDTVVW